MSPPHWSAQRPRGLGGVGCCVSTEGWGGVLEGCWGSGVFWGALAVSDSASPTVEFPAPKSEVVQRFPVCYLGCVPVAKPVGEWGTWEGGRCLRGAPPAHVGQLWGKGTPRVALTLPVPLRHGCDQRGTGGGAGPWLRGAPCTHSRGGQCGPRHPHHRSPPGVCPPRTPPCLGTPTHAHPHHHPPPGASPPGTTTLA